LPRPALTLMISIKEAAERIRAGEVVAFPTETVYGLGANALDADAVARNYELKGRPATSPLIVHVASIEMAQTLVTDWPLEAEGLARRYWPGPLTLVLPKVPVIPGIVTAGLPTVGLRVPNHPLALALIQEGGVPIAAPSANRFMGLSATTAEHVRETFGEAVPVLDGGPCHVGIESTVVSIKAGKITLLRPGMISIEDVEGASAPSADAAHPAPGMHPRHYSPRTPLVLSKVPDPCGAYIWINSSAHAAHSVQMPSTPEAYAARLYSVLHELDRKGLPVISVEPPPDTVEWAAVRDRLLRAASK
jgi:L-threonylcarbamoyladenylate synthase